MNMLEFLPFKLDAANQCLWRRTNDRECERVVLAPKSFDLLRHLVEHAGRLVTHQAAMAAVWPNCIVELQTLKQHVFNIRKALGDPAKGARFIETCSRRGYRFIAAVSDGQTSAAVTASRSTVAGHLVGRNGPLAILKESLHQAMRGQRQIVFVSGEPGIGKTALVDEFQRQGAAQVSRLRIGRGQCIEGYGGREAYYPMLEAVAQLCRGAAGNTFMRTLAAPAPTWLAQFPTLLGNGQRDAFNGGIDGVPPPRMLREISEALESITAEVPLLFIFEDIQWSDAATVDLLSALARRRAPAKLMLIATQRSVDCADHPSSSVKHELLMHGLCREIKLPALTETEVAEYLLAQSSDDNLPDGLASIVRRHSEGNPLFMIAAVEHMTKRGLIAREKGCWQLRLPLERVELEVPDNLSQMIEARIGRLSQQEQRVLEAASITGTTFSSAVNAAGTQLDPCDFEDLCQSLSRRHANIRPLRAQYFPNATISSRYQFAHAMYREVLYRRQPPGRRAVLHRRIGRRLEELFAGREVEVAGALAHLFEHGHDHDRASKYRRLADADAARHDSLEATRRLQHALDSISGPPPQPEPRHGNARADLAHVEAAAVCYGCKMAEK